MSIILAISLHDENKIALADENQSLSYGDVRDDIETRSKTLKDYSRVGLAMDNSVEWILWDLAAIAANVVLVPIPPFFTKEQSQHALKSAGCDGFITNAGIQPLPFQSVRLPARTAKITFTSGTTGTPKGVCLPQSSMEQVADSIVDILGPDLANLHCSVLPLAILLENIAGVYAALLAGATVILPSLKAYGENYSDLHKVLQKIKATSIIVVPEILRILMAQVRVKGPLSDLKFIAVGGSKISPDLILEAVVMGLPVYEGYGLSECGSVVSMNTPSQHKTATTGQVLAHVKIEIINGEIVVMNPGFCGYIGEEMTGPFATGDLGSIDSEGFVYVTGRKKNVLITSYGRNVSPEWVESVLLKDPDIAQAFVYGDAEPHLSALLVPSSAKADLEHAVLAANASLPDYAQIKNYTLTNQFSAQDGTLTGNGRMRRENIFNQRLGKENLMTFYNTLNRETEAARQNLYSVPQLTDALQGNISRESYIEYLTEAYHHVRHTVRFMMAMGFRLPESKKWLHDAISEYIEEEKGHEEWILNDIEAAGGDKEKARNSVPKLETQVLVAYNYDYIARKNPVGFLGMVFMLESTSIQIANNGADALKKSLNLPQSAFTYLYSHGALDIEHLKFFEQLVNKIEDPEDQAAIIEVAKNTFNLFGKVLGSIPHYKAMQNAA